MGREVDGRMSDKNYILGKIADKEAIIRGLEPRADHPSIAAEIRRQEEEIRNLRSELRGQRD